MSAKLPKAVDPIYSIGEAIVRSIIDRPVCINVRDGDPPMPAPWQPRMPLDGGTLYVHPVRERRALRRLARA
jgi:hypothetical protein